MRHGSYSLPVVLTAEILLLIRHSPSPGIKPQATRFPTRTIMQEQDGHNAAGPFCHLKSGGRM